jgi:gamma-glutamyltranspeptidase/glutathione hydrolase
VLTNLLDFKLDPYAAVDASANAADERIAAIAIEDRFKPGVVEDLHKLGVRVGVSPLMIITWAASR